MPVQITQGSGTNVDTAVVGGNNREITCVGSATAADTAGVTAANGVQVDVTRVQGNVAITAASLPLPAGASTAAKQPALGTAGTASADVISIQGIASMTAVKVDGSAVTQPVSGTVTANQGGTWTVQPGNTQNSTAWLVGEVPLTTGGCSVSSFLSTAAVQFTSAKASAGQVYGLHFFNNSGTICYIRLYNQTTAPASTDTANIIYRGLIPANTSGAGFVIPFQAGLAFSSGIGYRVTAAVADNDATALAANAILGNVIYK